MSRRVLVVGPNWLGDAVMAMPALQAWREANPGDRLSVMAPASLLPLWAMNDAPHEVIAWPPRGESLAPLVKRLREAAFDEAWILPNSVRSALPPWRARIPRRIGVAGHFPRRFLLTDVRPSIAAPDVHQAAETFHLFFGTVPDSVPIPAPRLTPPADAIAAVRDALAAAGCPAATAPVPVPLGPSVPGVPSAPGAAPGAPVVALVPGAARGPSKQWPPDHYVAAARAVRDALPATSFLLLGTPAEAPLCEDIARQIGPDAFSLAGKTTLAQMAAALSLASAVLCNDSGGMHLAAAVGTPLVAVFGITNPAQTGPLGPKSVVLQHSARRARKVPRNSPEAVAALAAVTPAEAAAALLSTLRP